MGNGYPPLPDWIQAVELVGAAEINELIACLTPAKRFDTRGRVFFIHDFECGWGMVYHYGDGTLNAQEISSSFSQSGGLSAKLTTGSDGDMLAGVGFLLPPLPSWQIGIQASFSHDAEEEILFLFLDYYDGVHLNRGKVGWDVLNKEIVYLDEDGVLQTVETGVDFYPLTDGFIPVKLVVDFDKGKYMRFLLGKWEVDLSAYDLYQEDSVLPLKVDALFEITGASGVNAETYVDDLILTVSEPS